MRGKEIARTATALGLEATPVGSVTLNEKTRFGLIGSPRGAVNEGLSDEALLKPTQGFVICVQA